jgi:acetyltransferase-like isoleucine patch superfamily enzyme
MTSAPIQVDIVSPAPSAPDSPDDQRIGVADLVIVSGPDPAALDDLVASLGSRPRARGARVAVHAPTRPEFSALIARLRDDDVVLRADEGFEAALDRIARLMTLERATIIDLAAETPDAVRARVAEVLGRHVGSRRERLEAAGVTIGNGGPLHDDLSIEPPVTLFAGVTPGCRARIGAFSYSHSIVTDFVAEIGRYCSIAHDVGLGEVEHPTEWLSTSSFVYDPDLPMFAAAAAGTRFTPSFTPSGAKWQGIEIGHDVWIGACAYVRAGVRIGTGAVIGAHAVVTRDVPPFAIVVGNPGRVVKYRFDEALRDRLLRSAWWEYRFTDFAGLDLSDPAAVLDALDARTPERYCPTRL